MLKILKNDREFLTASIFFMLLILSRMLPELPNFTPTISLMIFAATLLKEKSKLIFCIILSQIVSDAYLGFYDSIIFTYFAYLLISIISFLYISEIKFNRLIIISFISPLIFYIVTNFGVWFSMNYYTPDLKGLINSYIAGLPFLKMTTSSTILYTITMFMIYKYLIPSPMKNHKSCK